MRKKILWIEDGADFEATQFGAAVFNSRRYDFRVALTISEAIKELMRDQFDIVIMDIRMRAGDLPEWNKAQQKDGHERLGLWLLFSLLLPDRARIPLEAGAPEWIKPSRLGVMSIEAWGELDEDMKDLGIPFERYVQKDEDTPPGALLELIRKMSAENPDNDSSSNGNALSEG